MAGSTNGSEVNEMSSQMPDVSDVKTCNVALYLVWRRAVSRFRYYRLLVSRSSAIWRT